jgi:two-component system, OmpR family, sensor kinase
MATTRSPSSGHTFNAMLDRLEAAFEAQRELVDDAGHELRTPITIIRGHLELLSDDPEERDETLRLVMDELDRMGRMVEDLLLLAKAEQADFLHLQPVDVDEFIEDIAAKAEALGDRGWDIEMNAPVVMLADRQRITQAMMNLCRNAVEHTPDDTLVRIGSRLSGDYVWLWVTDDGDGIDPADRGRIFQRFARGASGPRSDGAGLGLSIVAAIAEAHGGHVRVHSLPGEGATFTLILPIEPLAEDLL